MGISKPLTENLGRPTGPLWGEDSGPPISPFTPARGRIDDETEDNQVSNPTAKVAVND
jgi:hypothetical protein